ncbi:MAG: amidohydrolase family protein [Planctomycetes bacterium]|nr:amidohydrolase family protein [Planctomycetota bacterium]
MSATDDEWTDRSGRVRARWLISPGREPLAGGVVEIVGGRIAAVHARPDPCALDLGNACIIPGLVNAHAHLEFSDLAEPLEPLQPFSAWIGSVVAHRRARASGTAAVGRGHAECAAHGTTCVADILTDDAALAAYDPDGSAVVAFREIIGRLPEQSADRLETARRHLAASPDAGGSPAVIRRGISPHAPYSVAPELYGELIALAAAAKAPVAVHLAETPAELELLHDGRGDLVEMLRRFGLWNEANAIRGSKPLDWLRPLENVPCGLVIHGNYLDAEEIEFLAERPHLTLVYCPRTHTAFGHPRHPWRELLARGGSVALGTDSRASNPDLNLWGEVQFLRQRFPDVPPSVLLELATTAGARALGLDEEDRGLSPGGPADLTVISLPDAARVDGWSALFAPGATIKAAMRGGRWLSGVARALR